MLSEALEGLIKDEQLARQSITAAEEH